MNCENFIHDASLSENVNQVFSISNSSDGDKLNLTSGISSENTYQGSAATLLSFQCLLDSMKVFYGGNMESYKLVLIYLYDFLLVRYRFFTTYPYFRNQ